MVFLILISFLWTSTWAQNSTSPPHNPPSGTCSITENSGNLTQKLSDVLRYVGEINLDGKIPNRLTLRPGSCTPVTISPMHCQLCNISELPVKAEYRYVYHLQSPTEVSTVCNSILANAKACERLHNERCTEQSNNRMDGNQRANPRNTSSGNINCHISDPGCPLGSYRLNGVIIGPQEYKNCQDEFSRSQSGRLQLGRQLEITCEKMRTVLVSELSSSSSEVFLQQCQTAGEISDPAPVETRN